MNESEKFERFCRRPGTRINAIMTMLERGFTDKQIAERFQTEAKTIKVYRKAYDGKLTVIEQRAMPQITSDDISDTFSGCGRAVLEFEHTKIVNTEAFTDAILEATGERNLTRAEGVYNNGGNKTGLFTEARNRRWMTARGIATIHKRLGVNLYKLGIVELEG